MVLDLMARNCSFPSSNFGSLQTMQSQHSKWVYIIHINLLLAILIVHCVIGRPEKVEMARPFKPNQRAARYNRRLHSSTETQMSASSDESTAATSMDSETEVSQNDSALPNASPNS